MSFGYRHYDYRKCPTSFMFGATPIDNDISIWLGCHSMPCFADLCWINEKMKLPDTTWCDPRCNNYDISVKQYLENEC